MVIHSISASRGSLLILPIQTKRVNYLRGAACVRTYRGIAIANSFNLVSALVAPSGSVARVRR